MKKGLSDAHFDAVAGHLEATLVDVEIGQPLLDEVLTIVSGTRAQVLGR